MANQSLLEQISPQILFLPKDALGSTINREGLSIATLYTLYIPTRDLESQDTKCSSRNKFAKPSQNNPSFEQNGP